MLGWYWILKYLWLGVLFSTKRNRQLIVRSKSYKMWYSNQMVFGLKNVHAWYRQRQPWLTMWPYWSTSKSSVRLWYFELWYMYFSGFIVLSHLSCGTHSLVVVELFVWPVTTCLHGTISWLCVGSLLNDKLYSMSHTIMFILNLIVIVIWCLLATHLHVFFPSMVCVSQEDRPCGYFTCLMSQSWLQQQVLDFFITFLFFFLFLFDMYTFLFYFSFLSFYLF